MFFLRLNVTVRPVVFLSIHVKAISSIATKSPEAYIVDVFVICGVLQA